MMIEKKFREMNSIYRRLLSEQKQKLLDGVGKREMNDDVFEKGVI